MSTLDLSPAPGAARLRRMVVAHAYVEVRLLLRNGEQLVLALALPLLVLVAGDSTGGLLDLGPGRRIDVLAPGVLALAVLSTSFTSLAIATGFERRYGVLKRLGATPLPRHGLLAGKVLAVLVVEALQVLVVGAVAMALGWAPVGGVVAVLGGTLLVLLGTAAFGALGLAMAGSLRAEATLALANLVYVLLLVAGAVVVPLGRYPEAVQPLVALLPSGALAQGLRDLSAGAGLPWAACLVLVGWAAAGTGLAARTFRWE
ncbi:MAG: ABC transporter permease [Nocardioidaceae bacterium]|nr:ABC transporter permease [Nocardioidaceae bacterium]